MLLVTYDEHGGATRTLTHEHTTPACSLPLPRSLRPFLPSSHFLPRSLSPFLPPLPLSHTGFFDHVAPPVNVPNPDGRVSTDPPFNFTRLGVRVPAVCTLAACATAPPSPLPLPFLHTARPRCCWCYYYCHCHCHCRCLHPSPCTHNMTPYCHCLPLLLPHHCRSLLRLGWTPALSFMSLPPVQEGLSATPPSLPLSARCSHPMRHS